MKCPFCSAEDTSVVDSRPSDDGNVTRRRRECTKCKKRFTTYERADTIPLVVIKKDNTRQPYDRQKIEKGVLSACYKRPVPSEKLNSLIDEVELEIFNMEKKEVHSKKIGELVMNKLHDLDDVAYVRFASVYREFKDFGDFMAMLNNNKK